MCSLTPLHEPIFSVCHLCLLTALFISTVTFLIVPILLSFFFQLPINSSILFGIGASLLVGALCVIGFYIYPIYRADNLKRTLDDSLPFTTGYMEILARAGMLAINDVPHRDSILVRPNNFQKE